ncbi:phosphate acetyltransferase [Microaceticoccus formicicus]|uniref:phosphate acetyltransferase n=1 Tax=Microaceticoccus formicicus TaxID=3118105 RepID=UPI003CD00C16|nr:phosphate acetyltransferase [Peptoniphilaceae bacterium AMB_02]
MGLFEELKAKLDGIDKTIVFPEGKDIRILGACARLKKDEIVTPIIIGKEEEVKEIAKNEGFDLEGIQIIDPDSYDEFDAMVDAFVERRKGKATEEQARILLKDSNYFGTMLVYLGKADGMVSGAVGSTGDTVRPALQIVKTVPGVSRISGAMVMMGPNNERYVFADIAINITLEADQLAELAVETAKTAKIFGIDPKVAMLSFSTMGSASSPEQEKVAEATRLAKEMAPELAIDGEMQFDAALVPSVGKKKAPESKVAGQANVFIFPDLQAGNIGYKIAERLGKFEAIGPILQGLNAPISDLSRGCSEEDVYKLAMITALQSL